MILKHNEPFHIWLPYHLLNLNSIAENDMPVGKNVEAKNITKFCSEVSNYLKQDRYFESCNNLDPVVRSSIKI